MKAPALTRRYFLRLAAGAGAAGVGLPWRVIGADAVWAFDADAARHHIIPAPTDATLWPEFRRQLHAWREARRQRLGYSDALYRRADFAWITSNFACCFLMLGDEAFYDAKAGRYTVAAFLEHGRREFGGYDSVVLWHAYPRIGLDDRNQFDFYRDQPGGLPGLRSVVDELHRAGVRAFIDYNPWDTGTRREPKPDLDALCDLVQALDADGIFLDTMDRGAAEFREKLDAVRPGVVLEGEIALPLERVHDHHASWAQWFQDGETPGVLRNKWFERRHLQHQVRRWDLDHTGELHTAWMNGSGMMVWENVFGSWVGWNARDRSILRAMLPVQRRYAGVFSGEGWTPLVPTLARDVYASLWEADGLRLWTLVNRAEREVNGPLVDVKLAPGERLFDLVAGREIASAAGRLRPRGIGCLLAGRAAALGDGFAAFLKGQRRLDERADFRPVAVYRPTRAVPVRPTRRHRVPPAGMAKVPAATLKLTIFVRVRECGFYDSVPAPGHRLASSYEFSLERFERELATTGFAMDRTPVTNEQFAGFLKAARYRPRHRENFLKHWVSGAPPAGLEDHPVVYVDLDDARAYAHWAGKRLPTEEEWQYAAQGTDGRAYPWGPEMLPGRCNSGGIGGTTSVTRYPDGRSPFGIDDLCGNVWEWTESERSDGRTRFCMIRGGSVFAAQGSGWYMDGGPRPVNFSAKFLLTWPGLDRCATLGFRCVVDLD